jgi:hypothetical protein
MMALGQKSVNTVIGFRLGYIGWVVTIDVGRQCGCLWSQTDGLYVGFEHKLYVHVNSLYYSVRVTIEAGEGRERPVYMVLILRLC